MVAEYVEALQSLLERVRTDLGPDVADIECRHFFGGAAAYADGRIFMTLTPVGLALKLPEDARAALMARGASALRYFPKGPIKKDYVVIPDSLAADDGTLAAWIGQSIGFSQSSPKSRKAE